MDSTVRTTGHPAAVESPTPYLDRASSLRDTALRLLRESNTYVPIGRLPPEILSAIFIQAAAMDNDYDVPLHTRFRVSGVSHRWRSVALSTRALWNTLVMNTLRDIPELRICLERATSPRITLVGPDADEEDGAQQWGPADAQFLLDEVPRAHSLHVDDSLKRCYQLGWPLFSDSLKQLMLIDSTFRTPGKEASDRLDTRKHRPFDLLGTLDARFPKLESLRLDEHGMSLVGLRLPASLVYLRIDNALPLGRTEDPAGALDCLRNLPALERLFLTNATTEFSATALDHVEPVSLPRLKAFQFEGHLSPCVALVKSLKLPSSARRMFMVGFEGDKRDLRDLSNALIIELAKSEAYLRSAFVSHGSGLILTARKEAKTVDDLKTDLHDPDHPKILEIWLRSWNSKDKLCLELLLSRVQTLVTTSSLRFIFRSSLDTHLDDLEILSCKFEHGKKAHPPDRHWFKYLKKCNRPLPRLRTFQLSQFSFAYYDDLLAFCTERQKTGTKLDVRLCSCYQVSNTQLDELRTVTSSVYWDGEENP